MREGVSGPAARAVALVDHLIYAVPDLARGVADLERLLGVRASPGGQHLGRGTHNALLAVGATAYLEIMAADPAQSAPPRPRWFGLDTLLAPRLVGWAARADRLDERVAAAAAAGVRLGAVAGGSRVRPDGVRLEWQLTDPDALLGDGVVPFLIDWGASPHPAASAAAGPPLVGLRAEHPEPEAVRAMLAAADVALPVDAGASPALVATFTTPAGAVVLR